MAGLLDWLKTPEGIGLLSAAAGTMAGARKGQPWNTAGRGLVTGLQGYAGAQDQIRQDGENALTKQFRQMQMAEMERKIADSAAMREAGKAAAAQARPMETVYAPTGNTSTVMPNMGGGTDAIGDYSMMGNASPVEFTNEAQQRPGQFDPAKYQSAYAQQLAERGMFDEAAKYAPKPDEYGTTPFVDAEGNAHLVGKTGATKTLPFKGAPKEGAQPFSQDLREYFAVNGIDPRNATPEQLQAGYNAVNNQKLTRAKAGGVTIGQLGPKYTEGVDKLGAQYLFEQFGEARNAATAVSAVNDAKVLLDQGMFTGRTGPWQESVAAWYQGVTGRPMPKLDATQQFKTVIGDIVLPALSNLKGASSDRDFLKIEEYSRGEATMTEPALKNHLDRLFNKYGAQINNFNTTLDDYQKNGGAAIPGLRRLETPAGNIKPPSDKAPSNGQTGKSKSGRPIIYRNGQWEYQ